MINVVLGGVVLMHLSLGVLYFVLATYMKRMRPWAVTATLVTAVVHTSIMTAGLIASLFRGNVTWSDLVLFGIFISVGVLLIIYCARSYRVIREFGAGQRGFEPIVPAIPVATDPARAANVRPPPPPSQIWPD